MIGEGCREKIRAIILAHLITKLVRELTATKIRENGNISGNPMVARLDDIIGGHNAYWYLSWWEHGSV